MYVHAFVSMIRICEIGNHGFDKVSKFLSMEYFFLNERPFELNAEQERIFKRDAIVRKFSLLYLLALLSYLLLSELIT